MNAPVAKPSAWAQAEPPRPPAPPGTEYAGVGIRFLAWLLDLVPFLALLLVVTVPWFADFFGEMSRAFPDTAQGVPPTSDEFRALMADFIGRTSGAFLRIGAIAQVAGLVYYAGSWLWLGRSPAQALLGLRVVREEDGGRPDLGRVAVRYVGYLLGGTFLLLGYGWALIDRRRQAWHDKLAGTLVVRTAREPVPWVVPAGSHWTTPGDAASAPPAQIDPAAEQASAAASSWMEAGKRPSIGALLSATWQAFGARPIEIVSAMAAVLIPAAFVLLPLLAVFLAAAQDQQVALFDSFGDALRTGDAATSSNARVAEISLATLPLTGLTVVVGIMVSALVIAMSAATLPPDGSIRRPRAAASALWDGLPTVLALAAPMALIAATLVILSVALSAGSPLVGSVDGSPEQAARAVRFGAVLLLGSLVSGSLGVYFAPIWGIALVASVEHRFGLRAAVGRAWALSRGRMRWLIGVALVSGLVNLYIVLPVAFLPNGLLAETYLAGERLPLALSLALFGPLSIAVLPLSGMVYVLAYRRLLREARPW